MSAILSIGQTVIAAAAKAYKIRITPLEAKENVDQLTAHNLLKIITPDLLTLSEHLDSGGPDETPNSNGIHAQYIM